MEDKEGIELEVPARLKFWLKLHSIETTTESKKELKKNNKIYIQK